MQENSKYIIFHLDHKSICRQFLIFHKRDMNQTKFLILLIQSCRITIQSILGDILLERLFSETSFDDIFAEK